jgi:hypothetical protein
MGRLASIYTGPGFLGVIFMSHFGHFPPHVIMMCELVYYYPLTEYLTADNNNSLLATTLDLGAKKGHFGLPWCKVGLVFSTPP